MFSRNAKSYLTIVGGGVLLVLAVLLGGCEWVAWRLGATVPLSELAVRQQIDPNLLWLGAFRDYAPFKLERIKLIQPEVLLVGNSRCSHVRAHMFRPYNTYNACLTAWTLHQIVEFVDRATVIASPKVVIIALDYFLFTDTIAQAWEKERSMDYEQGIRSHKRKLRDTFDYVARLNWKDPTGALNEVVAPLFKQPHEPFDGKTLIGTEAIRGNFGFRNDGSILLSPAYRQSSDANNALGARYFIPSFPGGQHLSENQLSYLKRLSEIARERGFILVAIQYPILKAVSDFLDTDAAYYPYAGIWREFQSEPIHRFFANLGILFFDLSRDPVASDSRNFIDPAHPGESGMLGAIIGLTNRRAFSELFPLINVELLRSDLARATARGTFLDVYH
jgi:hypothetical protein